jgi:FMN reductase
MKVAVVAGNPKPNSRTLAAAEMLASAITGSPPEIAIDVVTLGVGLLGFGDPAVAASVGETQSADLVIVASPTYKASFTGVLKCFLDQFPTNGLAGVVAIPLMLGAGPRHALAPELTLKPVLVELGATCPTRAVYLLDSESNDPASLESFLAVARSQLSASLAR